jgi:hypothetical protein
MPYIVTYSLNRENDGIWHLESLDELPKRIAEWAEFAENELGGEVDFTEYFSIVTGIYEVSKEINIREKIDQPDDDSSEDDDNHEEATQYIKDVYAEAEKQYEKIIEDNRARWAADKKKMDEAQFERLKKTLGK